MITFVFMTAQILLVLMKNLQLPGNKAFIMLVNHQTYAEQATGGLKFSTGYSWQSLVLC